VRGFSWSDEWPIRRHDRLIALNEDLQLAGFRCPSRASSPMAMGASACGTGLDPWRMSARIFPPRGGVHPTAFHRRITTQKCIRIWQLAGGLLSALLGAGRVSRRRRQGSAIRLGSQGNARLPRGRSPWIAQNVAARCSEWVSAKTRLAKRSFTTSARPAGTRPPDHCPRQTDARPTGLTSDALRCLPDPSPARRRHRAIPAMRITFIQSLAALQSGLRHPRGEGLRRRL
jgi:hypothetical protein